VARYRAATSRGVVGSSFARHTSTTNGPPSGGMRY
jgi:hypothetical protein